MDEAKPEGAWPEWFQGLASALGRGGSAQTRRPVPSDSVCLEVPPIEFESATSGGYWVPSDERL